MLVYTFALLSLLYLINVSIGHDINTEYDPYDMHAHLLFHSGRLEYYHQEMQKKSIYNKQGGWWLVPYTLDSVFDAIRYQNLWIRRVELDINMIHSCYEYKVISSPPSSEYEIIERTGKFCYPSIIITGVPKCSTSALFSLFAKYRHAITGNIKENCPFVREVSIIDYFNSLPSSVEYGNYIIDGCIDVEGNMIMRKILKEPNTFYLVITRNFADWSWSVYNYWCDPKVEWLCESHKWASTGVHKRSTDLFHQILMMSVNQTFEKEYLSHLQVSNEKMEKTYPIPGRIKNLCTLGYNMYENYITKLWEFVGRDAVLVVSSEELGSNAKRIWDRIVSAVGFPNSDHPFVDEFNKLRYNTQGTIKQRAENVEISVEQFIPGVYAISDFQPMKRITRNLLDLCWYDDCKFLSSVSEYDFPVCDDSVKTKKRDNEMNYNTSLPKHFQGFLRKQLRNCFKAFEMRYSFLDSSIAGKTKVLLIANNIEELRYLRNIYKFTFGSDVLFDLHSPFSSTLESTSRHCMERDVLIIGLLSSDFDSYVKVISSSSNGISFQFHSLPSKSLCDHSIVFECSKIIVISRNILLEAWKLYQLNVLGYANGIPADVISIMNWTSWDSYESTRIIQSLVSDSLVSIDVLDRLKDLPVSDILTIDYELLRSDSNLTSITIIKKMACFLRPKDCLELSKEDFQCSHQLSRFQGIIDNSSITTSSMQDFFDAAYASDTLLCNIEAMNKQQFPKLKLTFHRNFSCNTSSSPFHLSPSTTNECRQRYQQRTFLNKYRSSRAILVGHPSFEVTNIRLLIEHTTGILTGAIDADEALINLLPGENSCGTLMALMFGQLPHVSIMYKKSGRPTLSLSPQGKRKCMKGMIRGFDRGVLLLRDPYVLLLELFLEEQNLGHDLQSLILSDWKDEKFSDFLQAMNISTMLSSWIGKEEGKDKLQVDTRYDNIQEIFQDDSEIMLISYESILYRKQVMSYVNYSSNVDVLIQFSDIVDIIDTHRLDCSYHFLQDLPELKNLFDRLVIIEKIYSRVHRRLLHDLNQQLQYWIGRKFTLYTLFSHANVV